MREYSDVEQIIIGGHSSHAFMSDGESNPGWERLKAWRPPPSHPLMRAVGAELLRHTNEDEVRVRSPRLFALEQRRAEIENHISPEAAAQRHQKAEAMESLLESRHWRLSAESRDNHIAWYEQSRERHRTSLEETPGRLGTAADLKLFEQQDPRVVFFEERLLISFEASLLELQEFLARYPQVEILRGAEDTEENHRALCETALKAMLGERYTSDHLDSLMNEEASEGGFVMRYRRREDLEQDYYGGDGSWDDVNNVARALYFLREYNQMDFARRTWEILTEASAEGLSIYQQRCPQAVALVLSFPEYRDAALAKRGGELGHKIEQLVTSGEELIDRDLLLHKGPEQPVVVTAKKDFRGRVAKRLESV